MSYYPYLRGKRNELLCLRENSDLIAKAGIVPIIEPVRPDLPTLKRTIDALTKAGARVFVVAKPGCGQLLGGLPAAIQSYVQGKVDEGRGVSWIHRLESLGGHRSNPKGSLPGLLHDSAAAFSDSAKALEGLKANFAVHVFVDGRDAGAVHRKNFLDSTRVLIRDGFKKKKNAEYLEPSTEPFSDLHLTYKEDGYQGYGDFLPIGDHYSDKGGPAYAVAIHLTFSNPRYDGAIFVRHYVSDSNETADDPGAKFREAVAKVASEVEGGRSLIPATDALAELLDLHRRAHYPGLGYVKKLIMQHHIELMAGIEVRE